MQYSEYVEEVAVAYCAVLWFYNVQKKMFRFALFCWFIVILLYAFPLPFVFSFV